MRTLIYSDLQATDGHERLFSAPDESLQLWRVRTLYTELLALQQKYACEALWDLGDTFDDRTAISLPTIDAVLAGLEAFPHHDLNIKLIGNHDQFLRNGTINNGSMLADKFVVVDKPEVLEAATDTLVACAPYPASDAAVAEWLSKTAYDFRNYPKRILLGHFQVVGCQLNSGKALLGVPAELLGKYSISLLGHVHKPQQAGRNAFYVGSPFQQNFGEKNEAKRVGVLDLETLELTWVPMPGYPEYRVVDFADWVKTVKEKEEHRYQVIIHDPKQAEAFYRHPLMSRAEPIYNYELDERTKAEVTKAQSFSREDVMQRWLDTHPPGEHNIVAAPAEVLDVGRLLADNGTA